MQTIKHRSIAALGAIFATVVTVAAASPARAESVSVGYQDLDLRSPADMHTLRRRIRVAANQVCGPVDSTLRFQSMRCRRHAIAQAVASIPAARTASRIASR